MRVQARECMWLQCYWGLVQLCGRWQAGANTMQGVCVGGGAGRCWFNKEERKRPWHTPTAQLGIYSRVDKITGTESGVGWECPSRKLEGRNGILSQWFENLIRKLERAGWGFHGGRNNVYHDFTDRSVQNKLAKDLTQDRCRVLITGEKIAVLLIKGRRILCCCGVGQRCVITESIIWNITPELWLLVVEKFRSGLEDSEGHHQMSSPQF